MDPAHGDPQPLIERLKAAGTVEDVVTALADVETAITLAVHAQEPATRKAIMLLAAPKPEEPDAARLRKLVLLAAIASQKSTRPIVEEYAARALAEPIPDSAIALMPNEQVYIADWVADKMQAWVSPFASRMAVNNMADERLCLSYLSALVSRDISATEVIGLLTDALETLRSQQSPPVTEERRHLCIAISRLTSRMPMHPGRGLASRLSSLLFRHILDDGLPADAAAKQALAHAVVHLLSEIVRKYPVLLSTEIPRSVITAVERGWASSSDRRLKAVKKELFHLTEAHVSLLATAGHCAADAIARAGNLERPGESVADMCRRILEFNDIPSESVTAWLESGGSQQTVQQSEPKDSHSELEVMAQVLLRADELATAYKDANPELEKAVRETLLADITRLATARGLRQQGSRNETVPFDPMTQRSTSPVSVGARVRVLSPGVVRTTQAGQFQLVMAVVEPVAPAQN